MEMIEKMPWYDTYMLLTEGKKAAEKEIEELENPEKQLQRVKKFYQNLGADYVRNQWLAQAEDDIIHLNCGQNSRLSQLKHEVRLGTAVEDAVVKQDDESIAALYAYKEDEAYRLLVNQIMFYIGVSKAGTDIDYIEKSCTAVMKKYSPDSTALFIQEGVYYYIYYLQCLQSFLKRYRMHPLFERVRQLAGGRCMNLKLLLHSYREDAYIGKEVDEIFKEIANVEFLMDEEKTEEK